MVAETTGQSKVKSFPTDDGNAPQYLVLNVGKASTSTAYGPASCAADFRAPRPGSHPRGNTCRRPRCPAAGRNCTGLGVRGVTGAVLLAAGGLLVAGWALLSLRKPT